jgi:hypothetical protein
MRHVEQLLSRSAALLLTSSPAFLDNYFARHGSPPPYLVENKVFAPESGDVGDNPALRGDSAPIRIGWFGGRRCRKSLKALDAASRALSGHVEVVLRGRPALTEFDDFHATIEAAPHLDYAGAYRYPDDLAKIYAGVHFAWAIDFFEAGQNSRWLLPNRLYEGCRNGAIPIAVAGTETAAFIERLGIGIVIPDIEPATLTELFLALTPERVLALAQAVRAQDASAFCCDTAECVALVDRLADLAPVALEVAA